MSKILLKPLKHIDEITHRMKTLLVATEYSVDEIYEIAMNQHPKYFMYSSHDVQIGIIWDFIAPIA